MSTPLNVLLLEDRAADAELVLHALRRSGFAPSGPRVDTEPDYLAALSPDVDVILADYNLPQFDALSALAHVQARRLDIPFIVVSGTIGEELAVAAVREGATDYLLKDRLGRLGDAVRGALDQRRLRREKLRAEAALRASEEQFRSLVANIPDVTWRADPEGCRLFISPNAERVLALSPETFYRGGAAVWRDRIHPEDAGAVLAAYAALFAERRPFNIDYRFERGDGRWIWLHDRAEAVDEREGVRYADGVCTDITIRKQAEEALRLAKDAAETANRLKGEFLSTVSHELRTPLTAILGFGQLLERALDGTLPPKQETYLSRIVTSANHLLELIEDLLDLSKIDAGQMKVNPAVTNLPPLLAQVLAEFVHETDAKGLKLSLNTPPDLPPALADPVRTRQILINLVGNAVKFTDAGEITVSAESDEDAIAIVVADTGIGIDEAALEFIFDEFCQVDGGSTRRFSGIGLGLPIARKLAALQGGIITVTSQVGVGSVFTLRLPRAVAPFDHVPVLNGHVAGVPAGVGRDGNGER